MQTVLAAAAVLLAGTPEGRKAELTAKTKQWRQQIAEMRAFHRETRHRLVEIDRFLEQVRREVDQLEQGSRPATKSVR